MTDSPPDETTILRDAGQLMSQGRLDQAERLLRTIGQPTDRAALTMALGSVSALRGDFTHAAELFGQACELAPRSAMPCYQLGVTMIALGRPEAALKSLSRCVELDPNVSEAWFNLGTLHRQFRRFEESVACYRRAAEGGVGDMARLAVVSTLRASGAFEQSISLAREMLATREDWPEAWVELGLCLAAQGNVPVAASCWERAIELAPTMVDAHFHLGVAHAAQGKLDRAVTAYRTLLERAPEHVMARINLAGVLMIQGSLDGAVRELERAVQSRAPEAAMALLAFGDLELRRRDPVAAERRYRDAVGRMPREPRSRLGLVASLLAQRRGQDALAEADRFAREMPDRPECGECRAEALLLLGRTSEARAELESVVVRHGASAPRHGLMGRVLEASGDREGAVAAFGAALAINPSFAPASEGLARLRA